MATKIPGTVPEVRPLQPPPVDSNANISRNVNSITNQDVLPEGVDLPSDAEVQQSQSEITGETTTPVSEAVPTDGSLWWVGLIAIIVGLIVIAIWRKTSKIKN